MCSVQQLSLQSRTGCRHLLGNGFIRPDACFAMAYFAPNVFRMGIFKFALECFALILSFIDIISHVKEMNFFLLMSELFVDSLFNKIKVSKLKLTKYAKYKVNNGKYTLLSNVLCQKGDL